MFIFMLIKILIQLVSMYLHVLSWRQGLQVGEHEAAHEPVAVHIVRLSGTRLSVINSFNLNMIISYE